MIPTRMMLLIAAGVAVLALPATAQQYGERQDQGQSGDAYDGQTTDQFRNPSADQYGNQSRDQYGSPSRDQYGSRSRDDYGDQYGSQSRDQSGDQYGYQNRDPNDGQERPGYDRDQGYDQPRGDWNPGDQAEFAGYPEFRRTEGHIVRSIQEGLSDNSLHQNEAADLNGRLQRIRDHEMRVFRAEGWNLPDSDRAEIRQELDQLDRWVDEIRGEG